MTVSLELVLQQPHASISQTAITVVVLLITRARTAGRSSPQIMIYTLLMKGSHQVLPLLYLSSWAVGLNCPLQCGFSSILLKKLALISPFILLIMSIILLTRKFFFKVKIVVSL